MKWKLCLIAVCTALAVKAQHPAHARLETVLTPVLDAPLTDDALKGYSVQSMTMDIPAGYADTVAHRHDADLFVYITRGSVIIELEQGAPVTYHEGQMFHENRNILHKKLINPDNRQPARVLLFYVIKNGRSRYRKEQ